MRVYFDWPGQKKEYGKSAIACNCCGEMWSGEEAPGRKGKNAAAEQCERVANKNGWLILEEKNVHICDKCAGKMVERSYGYKKNI